MSLTPLLQSDLAIQIHAFAAMGAIVLGGVVLWRRKGTPLHKAMGRVWVVLMLVVATSSWFISEIKLIGPFSPIHLLSLLTYFGIGQALWAIRIKRNIAVHRAAMQVTYIASLLLAGAFTLLPGRIMHRVVFGDEVNWVPSLVAIGAILALAAVLWVRLVRRPLAPV